MLIKLLGIKALSNYFKLMILNKRQLDQDSQYAFNTKFMPYMITKENKH